MATGETVISLLIMLAIASSVTSVYHLQSPDDVSQLALDDANGRFHVSSQLQRDDMMVRRTPGWGKRRDDIVPALSQYATSKRRGWGKRDKCGYWRSLLQFIEVGATFITFTLCH